MSDLVGTFRESGVVWALGILIKGASLLLFVYLAVAVLHRASASLRHLVWGGGIAAVLVLPVVTLVLPWRIGVVPEAMVGAARAAFGVEARVAPVAGGPQQAGAVTGRGSGPGAAAPSDPAVAPVAPRGERPMRRSGITARALGHWALALWALGVVLVLARLGLGAVLLRRIVRRATPLDSADWTHPLIEGADRMELDELPRLVVSDRVPMPVVCGIVRPVIVVPAAAQEWTDGRRRAVLCHEIAHLRRRDLVVNLLGRVACAFHWFNPLVWFAAWRLRIESERACDDMVLGVGTRPSEYADHLLQIVCVAARARTPAVALPMAERRVFEGRMLAILERDARRAPPSVRQAGAVALLALFVSLPLAAMGTARQATPGAAQDLAEQSRLAPEGEQNLAEPGARQSQPRPQSQAQPQSEPQPQVQSQAQGLPGRLSTRGNEPGNALGSELGNALGNELGNQLANALAGRRDDSAQSGDTVDQRVVAALVRVLEDSVASVREDAAYALGRLEARGGVAALGARLRRDPVAGVRLMAAWALGRIESREGTAALADALRGDSSAEVRTMAIWALGSIEDPAAVPALVAALGNADPETRGRAAWAIGTIEPDRAPQLLIDALRDPVGEVRMRAAWALGQIEDAAAVPGLAALLHDRQTDAGARRAAVWALGAIESDASRQVLAELLADPDPDVRARAARAIGGSSEPWPWPWPMPIVR